MRARGVADTQLVLVRAGRASLHPEYAEGPYRVVVSSYEDPGSARYFAGGKFEGVAALLAREPELLHEVDYVWVPDDDVRIDPHVLAAMFALMRAHDLALAQPALTPDSHVNLPITQQDPTSVLRFTNFVEVMAPCFETALLRELLPWFQDLRFGWGLDFYWHELARAHGETAILDVCPMTHTRPAGTGALYASGDPRVEYRATRAKIPLRRLPAPAVRSRVTR